MFFCHQSLRFSNHLTSNRISSYTYFMLDICERVPSFQYASTGHAAHAPDPYRICSTRTTLLSPVSDRQQHLPRLHPCWHGILSIFFLLELETPRFRILRLYAPSGAVVRGPSASGKHPSEWPLRRSALFGRLRLPLCRKPRRWSRAIFFSLRSFASSPAHWEPTPACSSPSNICPGATSYPIQ